MKPIINAIKYWTNSRIEESEIKLNKKIDTNETEFHNRIVNLGERINNSKADWNENDSSSDNYVNNRPFYENTERELVVEKQNVIFELQTWGSGVWHSHIDSFSISSDKNYIITINEIEYKASVEGDTDLSLYVDFGDGSEFFIDENGNAYFYNMTNFSGNCNIKIQLETCKTIKIDPKFLPDNIATTTDVENAIDGKMNTENPSGIGSFSMNSINNSTIGKYACVLGNSNSMSCESGFAIGQFNNENSNYYQINVEDSTSFSYRPQEFVMFSDSYIFSDTDGTFTLIDAKEYQCGSGYYLGVEPQTNVYYTADGNETSTTIYYITSADDASTGTTFYGSKYYATSSQYVSVGNGTSDNSRSNAHTLDRNGNAWYAGNVYVGSTSGTNRDEGSKKLATEEYVDNAMAEVDINGVVKYDESQDLTDEQKTQARENISALGYNWHTIDSNLGIMFASYGSDFIPNWENGLNVESTSTYYENALSEFVGNLYTLMRRTQYFDSFAKNVVNSGFRLIDAGVLLDDTTYFFACVSNSNDVNNPNKIAFVSVKHQSTRSRWQLTDTSAWNVLRTALINDDGTLYQQTLDYTDTSLTKNGLPADAKVTGEALASKADKTDIVQSDWNENDEGANDFIQNRTHYVYANPNPVLIEGTYTSIDDGYGEGQIDLPEDFHLDVNTTYRLTLNDETYEKTTDIKFDLTNNIEYGCIYGDNYPTSYHASVTYSPSLKKWRLWVINANTDYYVKIEDTREFLYKKIDSSYLSDVIKVDETMRSVALGNTFTNQASGRYSVAENASTISSGYASHAEGADTIASGETSHAEGLKTIASGPYAHAENLYTTAQGSNSHAEGYFTTSTHRS